MNRSLLKNRNFSTFLLSHLISSFSAYLLTISIPILVYMLTSSTLVMGISLAIEFLPKIVISPFLGRMIDRKERKKIIVFSKILISLAILPLAIVQSPSDIWIVYAVSFAYSILVELVNPSEESLVPEMVDEKDIVQANTLLSTAESLSMLFGFSFGAMIVSFFGISYIVLITFFAFLLSAGLIHTLKGSFFKGILDESSFIKDLKDGIKYAKKNPFVRTIGITMVIVMAAQGIISVLGNIVFVEAILGETSEKVGYLASFQALGEILGGFLIAKFLSKNKATKILGVGLISVGGSLLVMFNLTHLISVLVMSFVSGVFFMMFYVGKDAIIQKHVKRENMGRSYTLLNSIGSLSLFLVLLPTGFLAETITTPITLLNLGSLLFAISGIFSLLSFRRIHGEVSSEEVQ